MPEATLPQVEGFVLPLLNLMRLLSMQFSSLLKSLQIIAESPGLSATASTFCVICKPAEGTLLFITHIINEQTEQH